MNWLNEILEKERRAHLSFFGKEFDLSGFEETLKRYGENRVGEWKGLLLEPHFLPEIEVTRKANFPGFKVRPDNHCYEVAHQGRVFRMIDGEFQPDKRADWLLGQTVLIDTRLKPAYDSGRQMWRNDNLLGPVIEELRRNGEIARPEYVLQSSRFEVSDLDWDRHIKPILAKKLNLNFSSLRLERVVEAVTVPQLYLHMPRKNDGSTNTWIWYEEFFEGRSRRLNGGDSGGSGLAAVDWHYSGNHRHDGSFRPLAAL